MARALLVEHEAYRVRACIGGGKRVVEVRDPADFDPSHKMQWSVASGQLPVKSTLTTDHWPLTTDNCLHQLCQRLAWVLRFHQRFADQERFVAGGSQASYVCAGLDSALGYADASGGYFFGQPECGFEIDFEGAQIAAVDADQVATRIKRALQFRFVMSLTQNIEAVGSRDPGQRYQFFLIERRDNQQDGVGAACSSFHDLEFIDDEILAQAGKRTAGRGLPQIVQRALKKLFVGQHRQRGGPCPLEFQRKFGWSEIGADQAF